MSFLSKALSPFSKFFLKLYKYAIGGSKEDKEDLTHLSNSDLEKEEKEMIRGIFALDQKEAKEIMVPRVDMVCIDERLSLEKIKELVKKEGHSRFPLIKENVDNVEGMIYVKDLFLKVKSEEDLNLKSLARKAYFVPESKKVDKLLKEMKRARVHIAIVVDEYGGTSGLVTLEDVLEEIVGEIQDEYDVEEEPIKRIDKNTFKVDANISLEDLREELGIELEQSEFETVGGLIYDLIGSVPQEGEILRKGNLQFYIEEVEGQRIKTVRVTKLAVKKENEK